MRGEELVAFANWLGHGHGERAEAWSRRLEVNRPELEAFRAARTPAYPAYVPRPAVLAPADGDSSQGNALRGGALEALEKARAHRELNAFTWLAEAPSVGFPIAIKDLMQVKGAPLSCGSRAFDRTPADRDAEVVARLRTAGAAIVGLANLHEFAYGISSDNPVFGRVVNPAAPARIPGGSSGGSAAAIAAGIVRLALGTDTAGSIRVPAACCGVVGFKPSYDALPRTGVIDLAASLDHVGPMAATVAECATLFAAMLGLAAPPRWAYGSLEGRTVARLGGYFADPLDPEVRAALDAAARALENDGARVLPRTVEGIELAPAIQFNTISAEATAFHLERLAERGADFGEDVRVRIEIGLFLPAPWYVKAQRLRTQLVEAIAAAFGEADVLLCPTMRAPAPAVGAKRIEIDGRDYALHTAVTNLTLPFNLAGLPAISVPWGRSRDGVPIALQMIGKSGEDWRVLGVAQRLEALFPDGQP